VPKDADGGPIGLDAHELPVKPADKEVTPGGKMLMELAETYAITGDLAKLEEQIAKMKAKGSLHQPYPYIALLALLLKDKQAGKPVNPGAAAPAAAADELPKTPNGISGSAKHLVDNAVKAAKQGDVKTLKEISEYADGYYDYDTPFKEHLADLLAYAEGKQGKPAAAPAAPASPKLTKDEIAKLPDPPQGADLGEIAGAKHYAELGDIEAVKFVLDESHKFDKPKTAKYLEALHAAMLAKQGGAAPAAAAPAAPVTITEADLPPLPTLSLQKNKDKAEFAKKLALAGDLSELMNLQMDKEYTHIGKLSGYIHNLVMALKSKGVVGAPSQPPQINSMADDGPKDGDTKPGADGMLIFKDGRWHKMGDDPKVLKQKAAAVPVPKLEGKNAVKYGKLIKGLKAIAEEAGGKGLALAIKDYAHDSEQVTITAGGMTKVFWKDTVSKGSTNGKKVVDYAMALQASMAGTSGAPAAAQPAATATPKAAASAPAAAPTISAKTEKVGQISAMVADGWEQTGPQKGSNPGGKFKDSKGQEWYCKFPDDPETVHNELLAAKFYEMLGAAVPQLRLVKKDGKLGIASKWVDGIKKGDAAQLAKAPGAHGGFVFDAWLANWDVVGLSNDNLMLDKDGKAVRIDVGGSLIFRAMGGKKGAAFGKEVGELQTLIDGKNAQSTAVFKGISNADLLAGGHQLAKMHPSQISTLVDMFGPGSEAEKAKLAETLIARRADILAKLGLGDPWNAPPVDTTKLEVNAADLPPAIDFNNYPGKNGPLSSKKHINDQNTIDDAALITFAKQGNLKALQEYQYDAYDKETGKYIGKKPIAEHPSKDIKNHWASLCDLLTSIAHPPVEGLDLPPLGGGSIEEVAEQAGYFKPGENIKTISAEKVVGFWMKLGHVGADTVKDLMPQNPRYLKSDFVNNAKKWYQKASETTKALVNSIQDSGHYNRFWNNGDKHISISSNSHSYSGGAQTLANKIYQEAYEFDEGETIGRWMNLSEGMKNQLLKEGPGLVFQNADSMCASIFKDWGDNSHFGSGAFLNIKFAKGAKAMASLGSGRFKGSGQDKDGNYIHAGGGGEMEVTTLMGQRFVVLGIKKGNASSPNGITLDLLALPPHEGYVAELGQMAALGKSFGMGGRMVLFLKRKGI
jgi:hypothetical protein